MEQVGIGDKLLILISLGVVAGILAVSVIASVIAGPREPLEDPPEATADDPAAKME